jgi:predicted nucleotidyltransferase component of viral defense system
MEQTVLTPRQEEVLKMVASRPELRDFYLSGGTAIAAFYYHHRLSDDLDFFTDRPIDLMSIRMLINQLGQELGAHEVRMEKIFDRHLFFLNFTDGDLKMEFTSYPFMALGTRHEELGIIIDSQRDLAANKLAAMLDRFDPKDFVDLYFLLQDYSLQDVRHNTETKFGLKIGDIFLGSELAKVRRVEALPKMLKPLTVDELKKFFSIQARSLESSIFKE